MAVAVGRHIVTSIFEHDDTTPKSSGVTGSGDSVTPELFTIFNQQLSLTHSPPIHLLVCGGPHWGESYVLNFY